MKDYYKTLNVSETATDGEIKKAFRTLARKTHPDKNKAPGAEDRFKDINEAYNTLKDSNKRSEYDTMKKFGQYQQHEGPNWSVHSNVGNSRNFEDIFSSFFGDRVRRPTKNQDVNARYTITLEEAFFGADIDVSFKHQNIVKKLKMMIPEGIQDGSRVKFSGEGDNSDPTIPSGDLLIQVRIASHPVFQRNGNNLYCSVDLDVIDAIIGIEKDIKTIDNKTVRVKIPPGTKHDSILKVAGYGMKTNNRRGILYVQIKLVVPNNITQKQKDLLLKYKNL